MGSEDNRPATDRFSEAKCKRLFASLQAGMIWLQPDGRIVEANRRLSGLVGYSPEELQAMMLWELGGSPNVETDQKAVQSLQRHGYLRSGDLSLRSQRGVRLRFRFQQLAQRTDLAQLIECRFLNYEPGEQVANAVVPPAPGAAQTLLPHLEFEAVATAEIQRMQQQGQPLSLLSVSISRSGGRSAGDIPPAVLPIGNLMETCAGLLRKTDVIGRVDDNIFVALLPKTNSKGVLIVAERLRTAIAAFDAPSVSGRRQRVMASIGTVTTRAGRTSYPALRSRADAKREDARHIGGNRINA